MKDDVVDQEETKSTTSQLPPQPTPVHPPLPIPTIHLHHRNSLVFPTPVQTLSLLHIKDRRHGFALPNGDATAILLLSPPPSFDAGLTPITPTSSFLCHTSLRDLIASASSSAAMNSPTLAVSACYQILIRNRLVKQAAWAYLQPMSSSRSSVPLIRSYSSADSGTAYPLGTPWRVSPSMLKVVFSIGSDTL